MIYNKLLIYTQHNIIYNMNIYIHVHTALYIPQKVCILQSQFSSLTSLPNMPPFQVAELASELKGDQVRGRIKVFVAEFQRRTTVKNNRI